MPLLRSDSRLSSKIRETKIKVGIGSTYTRVCVVIKRAREREREARPIEKNDVQGGK